MLDPSDTLGWSVVTRLLDFFGDRTAWHRRLWAVGSATRLLEVSEAVEAFDGVPAAQHALAEARASARDFVKKDPGVASQSERGRIAGLLSGHIAAGSLSNEQLSEIAELSKSGYLARWAGAIRAGEQLSGAESIARYVASYLLDGGSSSGHLYRWFTRFAIHDNAQTLGLAELLDLADEKIVNRSGRFEVVVPFESVFEQDQRPEGWLERVEVAKWLASNGFSDEIHHVGGLRRTFEVRDAGAAAETIAAILDTYRGRVTAASDGDRWKPCPIAYVAGARDPIHLGPRRRANVPVLAREDKLFSDAHDDRIDSALQLVSLLEDSPAPAAVAGAWAGVESLLKAPGDGGAHEVAPRIARLVACSFCRSELTTLAWRHVGEAPHATRQQVRQLPSNRARARWVADEILADAFVPAKRSDQAGVARMRKILQAPRAELDVVRSNAEDALRRLYRQRNLVLHQGRTNAVALAATLRVTAPLVGAGLDRVVHGYFIDDRSALRTAAVAELQLARIGTPDGLHVTELLDGAAR